MTMHDDDIYAFNPPPGAAPSPPPRTRRRVWPWLLGALLVLALLATAGAVAALMALADSAREGVHVVIGGESWEPPLVGAFPAAMALLGIGGALLVAFLVVVTVVPLAVLLAVLCVLLAAGGAALAALVVVAVVLSPLWLVVLPLWWMLRSKPAPAASIPA
jgi:hypothetical protein